MNEVKFKFTDYLNGRDLMSDISKTAKSLFGLVEKINKTLSEMKDLEILNQELVAKTPELLGEYSVAISSGPFVRKLKFPFPAIVNLYAHSMPDYSDQRQAISRLKDGFEISLDRILPTSNNLLLSFEFRIKDNKFVKKLVRKDVQHDSPRGLEDESDEYWMHAQLKHLKILERLYRRLDLRDIDFGVNVAVHQDLKTAIPSDFVRNLKIIAEWIKTKDRVKKWRLGWEHLRLGPKSYTGKENELISDIQSLFFPQEFKRFVEVTEPFRYYESVRGVDFYDLPFQAFPKTMTVVSRTTLNLESPAAKGKLIYKKHVLRDEISRILGILEKKKKRKRRPISIVRVTEKQELGLNGVISKIEEKLRPTIHKIPEKEKEIQDALENLFIALDYDFEREQVSFSYSTKSYKPDFTSDSLRTAVDVKLCKDPPDEKRIIDEINADIPAYKSHYENLLFVVYDLGCIRKVTSFTKGIEKAHEKVFVQIIKH